jgi:hypothetical protein
MNDKEFVQWLRGFVEGVHHYNITPKQWDYLKETLQTVGSKTSADYTTGNWTLNHTWE